MSKNFGFVGCGNMQTAILKGILDKKLLPKEQIWVFDRDKEKTKNFQSASSNLELAQKCKTLILGTKPVDLPGVLKEIAPEVGSQHTVISIAAGFPIALIKKYLPKAKAVVRIMPNTPCMVAAGVMGIYMEPRDGQILSQISTLFAPMGRVVEVTSDDQINSMTAASASGSGFVFYLMEGFSHWLEHKGFTKEQARAIAVDTFWGAGVQARLQSDRSLKELRESVTSKKGTTEAGLKSMKESDITGSLEVGLEAAFKRGAEIAQEQHKLFG